MSEQREFLADSVARVLEAQPEAAALAQTQGWQRSLWSQLEELGIPGLLVPESSGGVGADWEDACAVLHAIGHWQTPLPVAETIIAQRLISAAGLEPGAGAMSLSAYCNGVLSRSGQGWRFSGELRAVPWGRDVELIAGIAEFENVPHLLIIERGAARVNAAENLAGEPRDQVLCQAASVQAAPVSCLEALHLFDYAALARTAQIGGALQSALDRTIAYAQERKQFGKSIGQFQAIQHQLALYGEHTAAVACAVRGASIAASVVAAPFQIAAAKLQANQTIPIATATAHQVHGAIGFTREYALRHATQRLWSWRSEFGADAYWRKRLGELVIGRGADRFWSDLTARDDRAVSA